MQLRDDWRDHAFRPSRKTHARATLLLATITLLLVLAGWMSAAGQMPTVPPTDAEAMTLAP